MGPACAGISVIIPTRDEEGTLRRTLQAIPLGSVREIIVADAGSHDRTVEVAQAHGAQVVHAPAGRALQMNAAAAVAEGDTLLCLHADTILPAEFEQQIREALSDSRAVAGAFLLRIESPRRSFRWIEWCVNWRSRLLRLPYGDQALFCRAQTFRELNGYPELPVMEDVALVRRLRRRGRFVIVSSPVETSARRWIRHGVWRTTVVNLLCLVGYLCGVRPGRIARWRETRPLASARVAAAPEEHATGS